MPSSSVMKSYPLFQQWLSAFQLEHMPWLLRSVCPGGYRIRTIEYEKILVLLVYGKYYGRVYEVYNK